MSPSKPLSERSPNQPTSPSKGAQTQNSEKPIKSANAFSNEKPIPRFELNTNTTLSHGPNGTTYISPSDAIRSPTSKKLSEIKGKRFQYVPQIYIYMYTYTQMSSTHLITAKKVPLDLLSAT